MNVLDEITTDLASRVLPDGRTWLDVATEACRVEGVRLRDSVLGSRLRPNAHARHRAWAELYRDASTCYSYHQIADAWDVDHTTVMAGVRSHEERHPPQRKRRAA